MEHRSFPRIIFLSLALSLFFSAIVTGEPDRTGEAPGTAEPSAEAAPLSGKVLLPDGKPAAGAKVRVLRREAPVTMEILVAGEDGSFRAKEISGDNLSLRIYLQGYTPIPDFQVSAEEPYQATLARGRTVTVRILDGTSGEPIPGGIVELVEPQQFIFGIDSTLKAEADDTGTVHLSDIPVESVRLRAWAPGYRSRTWTCKKADASPEPEEQFLHPGHILQGTVVDPDGKPVPLASLFLQPNRVDWKKQMKGGGIPKVFSDLKGRFRFLGLEQGGRYNLLVRTDDYADWKQELPVLEPDRSLDDYRVTLSRGSSLHARLVDPDADKSVPLEFARLDPIGPGSEHQVSGDPLWFHKNQAQVEEDGGFTLSHVAAGRYRLTLQPENYEEVLKAPIVLRAGKDLDLGEIPVRPGKHLAGVIRSTSGEPVARAHVSVTWREDGSAWKSRRGTSDEQGVFRVGGLPDLDIFHLSVTHKGFVDQERKNQAPADDLEIRLSATGGIQGTVTVEGGKPPASYSVRAYRKPEEGEEQNAPLFLRDADGSGRFSDEDGSFRLDGLPPGSYTIQAKAPAFAPGKKRDIQVREGEVTSAGEIPLQKGLEIHGQVVTLADHRPVPGAGVVALPPSNMRWVAQATNDEGVITDRDGRFTLDGLEPGTWIVQAQHAEFSKKERTVQLKKDEDPPDIRIELASGGVIAGRAVLSSGEPEAGAKIIVTQGMGIAGEPEITNTDSNGEFRLERIPAGSYNVMKMPVDFQDPSQVRTKSAQVKEGEVTYVNFGEESPIELSGTVLRGDEPIGSAMVVFLLKTDAQAGTMNMRNTNSDESGRYSIGLDRPGEYVVQVMRMNPSVEQIGGTVVLVPDEERPQRDIVLPSVFIQGQVTDENGEPVPNASVTAQQDRIGPMEMGKRGVARTDETGSYNITGIEAGTYTVQAAAPGYAVASKKNLQVPGSGTSGIDLILRAGRVLRGRAVNGEGKGVSGAMILLLEDSGSTAGNGVMATSDINGLFSLNVAEDGSFNLIGSLAGYAPAIARGVRPAGDGDENLSAVLRFTPGGTLRVRVLDPEGTPLEGRSILFENTRTPAVSGLWRLGSQVLPTGADGITVLRNLTPGGYELRLSDAPDRPGVEVQVREGETTEVELTAAP